LVTSARLLEEFSEVITRRHIARKYPKAAQEAETLLDFLRAFAILAPGIPEAQKISPIAMMISCWPVRWCGAV
jgi:hypothetical protein